MHPQWRHAMSLEFNALLQNHTWILIPLSLSYNLLDSKWVLKIKHRIDSSLEHRKGRLVAQGFHQQLGLDYSETFNPIVKPVTIRTILSLIVSCQWPF